MKTIPVSLIVAGLLVPVAVHAQTPGDPPVAIPGGATDKHGPSRPFAEAWKAADTNHDGFISKEEFDGMPRIQNLPEEKRLHLFKRLDKDGDDRISGEELGRMGKPHDGQGPPMQRLWELDVDKSGGISPEEFKAGQLFKKLPPERQDELFRRLDTDRDGLITPKDKPEPPFRHEGGNPYPKRPDGGKPDERRMEPRPIIRQLDPNHGGAVSFDEFRARPAVKDLSADEQKARFEMMNRNRNPHPTPDTLPTPAPRGEPKPPKPPKPPAAPAPALD